jgi:AraC-like DNA-binding protein
MNYIFNAEKIKRLLSDFYLATEIAVTFYDSDMNTVATSPVYSDYCKCIRGIRGSIKNCNLSNFVHMERAAKTREVVSYTCHAGLMEMVMPVLYEDTIIGYMQIGQFKDKEAVYSSRDGIICAATALGLSVGEADELYGRLPEVSAKRLGALCEILLVLIRSFWEDGLIRHNRSMLSVRIEQYVTEHIRDRLYIEDICRHFFISKNALYTLFSAEFGTTVGKYILQRKLQRAAALLREGSLAITAVAAECGFSEYNYFIRAFKKQYSLTPLQYRKKK